MTAITEKLDGARNVLLAGPSMGGSREVCQSLLAEQAAAPSVLFVSYTQRPAACVDRWDQTGNAASNLGVVTVGDSMADLDREDVVTENVSTPSDLTGLGIKLSQFLSDWDAPVFVCFDSLTSMLQYVSFETAYEFLHAVTGQVQAADALAHFHIDPSAHDETEIAGITSLVDARITVGQETTVRTRDVIE